MALAPAAAVALVAAEPAGDGRHMTQTTSNTSDVTAPTWAALAGMMWRQWRWDLRDVQRQLPDEAQRRVGHAVTSSEQGHTGQIRVVVESSVPVLECLALRQPGMSQARLLRERALMHFGQLGVWDTADNNGVLIYLLMSERAIEVVADRGVCTAVGQADWDALVGRMAKLLAQGHTEQALIKAIAHVDVWLRQQFAHDQSQPASPNELADTVVVC